MGVESDTVRCKNCTSVIWRKVESSCSHVETCTLPYVLWVLVEVEISSCKSKAPFSIVETVTCQIPGKSKHASHPKAKRRDDFSRRSCASLASLLGVLTQGAFSFSCIFARVALGASARRQDTSALFLNRQGHLAQASPALTLQGQLSVSPFLRVLSLWDWCCSPRCSFLLWTVISFGIRGKGGKAMQ